jgi:catechol 1,2-dioxygenase
MQRRAFLKKSGLFVLSVGVVGNIQWTNNNFVGDTPTTTDILGPYYRPDAPIRTNINPQGYTGELLHLRGAIFEYDGKTPFQNCLIEVWQCDHNQVYDNTSDEYRYRGSQKTARDGQYHFITAQPVPYPAASNSNIYRPAHIHMRLSGEKQQDLITQIYFKGDPNIEHDPCSSSPGAINRILSISNNTRNEKTLRFDVVMVKESKPSDTLFEQLTGLYIMSDKSIIEFDRDGDLLFMKWNGQFREAFSYKGNNQFAGGMENKVTFELSPAGETRVNVHFVTVLRKEFNLEGVRSFKYKGHERMSRL